MIGKVINAQMHIQNATATFFPSLSKEQGGSEESALQIDFLPLFLSSCVIGHP